MRIGLLSAQDQALLAERIHKGDPSAEEEFIQLFSEKIQAMMLTRTRDPEAAGELVQDVLVAVLRALRNGQVREPERLAAFVYGTARNLVSNYLRARGQRPREEQIDLATVPETCAPIPQTSERLDQVREAMRRLDPADRKILEMTLVEGMKPQEIAQQLGLNAGLVRTRKSRAIKKVIENIKKMSR